MARKTKQPSQGINSHYEENQLTTDIQEHSLQTGKWIQSGSFVIREIDGKNLVSIPFKRESGFKGPSKPSSTTKAKQKVSIPFKRESGFKDITIGAYNV